MKKICLDDLDYHAGLAIGLVRSHRGPGIRLHVSLFAGPTDQTSRIARQQEGLGYAWATDGP